MQKNFLLGVSVGESFAEFSLLSGSQPLAQKRIYLSRENLKQGLMQFVTEHFDKRPEYVFVSLRLPKKLLNFNLSGAVAHITTEGLESWLELCGNKDALTNKDLIFSVRERILPDGQIEVPLNLEEIESIAAKLQMVDCKKVCLHFLHATTNPLHVQAAREVLHAKGIEVFIPEKSENTDEVSRWNRNALNATISGVFTERKNEIFKALETLVEEKNIHFLNSTGKISSSDALEPLGSLFSSATVLGQHWGSPKESDVLYLGLENFLLISSSTWNSSWKSNWGSVEIPHLQTTELGIQPTLGITLNSFGRFDFSSDQEGWEPGPMFWGRGQKPCLVDLWAENAKLTKLQGLEDRLSAPGIQRFKNALFALSKTSNTRNHDLAHLSKDMQSLTLQRLAVETYLQRQNKKLIVTGPMASVFANAFKKDSGAVIETEEFSESVATALCGMKALQ